MECEIQEAWLEDGVIILPLWEAGGWASWQVFCLYQRCAREYSDFLKHSRPSLQSLLVGALESTAIRFPEHTSVVLLLCLHQRNQKGVNAALGDKVGRLRAR